jgi:hypothetical protein
MRAADLHAVRVFAQSCERRELELVCVTPGDVGRHLDPLAVAALTHKVRSAHVRIALW